MLCIYNNKINIHIIIFFSEYFEFATTFYDSFNYFTLTLHFLFNHHLIQTQKIGTPFQGGAHKELFLFYALTKIS